jgi:hypothetical protein
LGNVTIHCFLPFHFFSEAHVDADPFEFLSGANLYHRLTVLPGLHKNRKPSRRAQILQLGAHNQISSGLVPIDLITLGMIPLDRQSCSSYRCCRLTAATPGQPSGNPALLFNLLGVDLNAAVNFGLFLWITKPATSANGLLGFRTVCLLVEPKSTFVPVHVSAPLLASTKPAGITGSPICPVAPSRGVLTGHPHHSMMTVWVRC